MLNIFLFFYFRGNHYCPTKGSSFRGVRHETEAFISERTSASPPAKHKHPSSEGIKRRDNTPALHLSTASGTSFCLHGVHFFCPTERLIALAKN